MKISLLAVLTLAACQIAQAAPDLMSQFPVKAAPVKTRGAAQAQVALRGAFPTISKADLKGALDAKNLDAARKNVGKTALFSGVVTAVFAPKSGAVVLINFAKNYKTALVGSVRAKDFRRFPSLQNLKGKRVALRGQVVLFKGAPEIELAAPGAIRIVK